MEDTPWIIKEEHETHLQVKEIASNPPSFYESLPETHPSAYFH